MASHVETLIRDTVTKGIMKVAAFNRNRLSASVEPNRYLHGIHTPMDEEKTITGLKVTGAIPPELDGRYLRIGPNPVVAPNPATYHWFTGDGMVHGVRLKEGQALWYRNRWMRSTTVSKALGEPAAPGPRNPPSDTVNTNVLGYAGKIWALVEAGGFPLELDGDLNTVAHNPFEGTLSGSFSAHPHLDPESGEMHAICYYGLDQATIRHVVVGKDGKVRREEPIAVKHGPSIHDCMITKNFVLVFDLPVTFSMKNLLAGFPFPYAWNPQHRARVGVLPKDGKGSDIVWCEVDPAYVFHPCNASEAEDGTIVVDLAVHGTMFAESTQGPDSQTLAFERWTVDTKTKKVARKVLDDHPQEFPRCNERFMGKPYRYAYAMPVDLAHRDFESASHYLKHDLHTGTRSIHEFGSGRIPGEFVFVPKRQALAEDEGWLMGYVIDKTTRTTDLVIIDAQHFSSPPVATITIPHQVPAGFHGNWIPSA